MATLIVTGYDMDVAPFEYKGDYDATATPTGELIILENVPDVGNKNNGEPHREVRAIFAKGSWDRIEIEK